MRNLFARCRQGMADPSPTIVIFCRHVGGYGGEENNMACTVDALKGVPTKVFVQKTLYRYGMLPEPREDLSIEVYRPKTLIRFIENHAERIGIFIRISPDPFDGEKKIFRLLRSMRFPKAVVPAGNDVSRVVDHFDYIFWQADNADDFGLGAHPKNVVLRPPALHANNLAPPLPLAAAGPYFFTVFNPYNDALKGTEMLYEVLDRTDATFVWCSQDSQGRGRDHPRLHRVSCSRNLVLALMKNCRAYVSFSQSEGFGWSVFEAMVHGRPVISRPVGIAKEYRDQIRTYRSAEELIRTINDFSGPESVQYDLTGYEPRLFRERLFAVIDAHRLAAH